MRIEVIDQCINIKKARFFSKKAEKAEGVLRFDSSLPIIDILENGELKRSYAIEPLLTNPNLKAQFLHYSVSVQQNNAVMIDGIISKSDTKYLTWNDDGYEAIRLQPFYLKESDSENTNLIGQGLFQRGLHYSFVITPLGVRNVCICDICKVSFTLQHVHAGFSGLQYFYSTNSNQTLLVSYNEIENMPQQLAKAVSESTLNEIETKLLEYKKGDFKYYNSLRCPHCSAPFINFNKNKEIRPGEYYANKLINTEFIKLTD